MERLKRNLILAIALVLILTTAALLNLEGLYDAPDNPSPASRDTSGGGEVKPTCKGSLQQMVDGAPAGTVVEATGECVYRETVTINKPLTLNADPGTEIRGSDVWTGWTKTSGPYWVRGDVPRFHAHGECESGTIRCLWPEQVFFDGKPLRQVASDPESGQFAVDGNRRVILADDPSKHIVEVATRTHWIVGQADGVTIQGFTMKHAANDAQTGALDSGGHSHWTILDNDLSYAHGVVLNLSSHPGCCSGGTDLRVLDNNIHHGGQLGVASSGLYHGTLLMEGNDIHSNNTEAFYPGWEAGGVKATRMASFVAEHNNVYSNYAHGIWCDIDCKNVTYSDNRVHDNDRVGLLFEISDGAKISGNIVWENGWGNANSGWGAGIMAASSSNVEIYNNTLAWNNSGISVVSQDRGESRWNTVRNISVHDNTILAKDYPDGPGHFALRWWQSGYAGVLFDPTSDNRGADNRYWYPGPEGEPRYSWGGTDYRSLARFDTTPGEQNAYYLTDAQKDHVLSVAKIPASPKERPCSTLFARITPRLGFVSDLLWNLYIKLGLYKC